MPIYEYEATKPDQSCRRCRTPFEVLQKLDEEPLTACPECANAVRKIISRCRAAIAEGSEEDAQVTSAVRNYESAGMWSHAAELADTHSEKTGDPSLKNRALDNYKKAGYNVDTLVKGSS